MKRFMTKLCSTCQFKDICKYTKQYNKVFNDINIVTANLADSPFDIEIVCKFYKDASYPDSNTIFRAGISTTSTKKEKL